MGRDKLQRFKKDYSNKDILHYLKRVSNLIGRSPTYRDLDKLPGPTASTVVRRFGSWSKGLKIAGIRPHTNQLMKGEKTFIRKNWHKMTDKEVADQIGVSETVIKYYRMNSDLWKNHKGTAKSTYRKEALKIYGEKCEICHMGICEWHHIVPKSTKPEDWCILCPICHEVITRKIVTVNNRMDLKNKLLPYVQKLYRELKI